MPLPLTLYYCFGIPREGLAAPKVELKKRLVKLGGCEEAVGTDEGKVKAEGEKKLQGSWLSSALIKASCFIGEGRRDAGTLGEKED